MLYIFFRINWQEVAKQNPDSALPTGKTGACLSRIYHMRDVISWSYIIFTSAASRETCQQLKIPWLCFCLFFTSLRDLQSKLYQHISKKAFKIWQHRSFEPSSTKTEKAMYPNTQILLDERWCSWRKSVSRLYSQLEAAISSFDHSLPIFSPTCYRVFTHQINWDLSPFSDITFAENKKVTSGHVMQFSDVGLSPPICNFPNRTLRHCYSYTQVHTKGEFCQRSHGRKIEREKTSGQPDL